jgi:hypothetical protein
MSVEYHHLSRDGRFGKISKKIKLTVCYFVVIEQGGLWLDGSFDGSFHGLLDGSFHGLLDGSFHGSFQVSVSQLLLGSGCSASSEQVSISYCRQCL